MAPILNKYLSLLQFLLPLLLLPSTVLSGELVTTLPGFAGQLPFTLETGYTTVGDIEFFYYFVHSETNPAADPILLYLNGGPGCSALNGFLYQVGPLKFDADNYTSGLPSLQYVPWTWTKSASILFLDSPVGAGFSYSTTPEGWNTSDTKSAEQIYDFVRNWLTDHSNLTANPVYVASDSYAGLIAPMVAVNILEGNAAGLKPIVNLKGLSLGCPHTNTIIEINEKITFAHHLALISDTMYETAYVSCNGSFADVDASNAECTEALDAITQCIELINVQNILEPYCSLLSPKEQENAVRRSILALKRNILRPLPKLDDLYCQNFPYLLLSIWANYQSVQDALHVRPGTISEFRRCNITMTGYTEDSESSLEYHKNLTETGLQLLVFSGDHDMIMPHNGIELWISYLDLTLDIDWRPWFINGQVAGYTRSFENDGYRLTYATIKGAGHSPQEYQRKNCFDMYHRWINHYPV